ncbi:hypothetical protein AQJ43_28950 [Streptomyces avermitilis]|nr:hypothetical protein AQJ43_28950 [Streptomyces avermitilis]OOV20929.1 hypothetical protein SM007_35630 [Streptomyces avermitilis]
MGVLVVGDAQDPEGSFRFVADGPGGLGDVAGFEALKASMARLRKAAMARGAEGGHGAGCGAGVDGGGVLGEGDVLMWWLEFSTPQCPRMAAARSAGLVWWASRLVTL